VKEGKQAEENKCWKKSRRIKSGIREAGRRDSALEEEQEGLKGKQEKRAEEQEIWKKSRRG
jgi:hypothetical protein